LDKESNQDIHKPSAEKIVIGAFSDITRTRADLIAENALLRPQLIIIKRQIKRPQLTNRDRLSLAELALSSLTGKSQ